MLSESHMTAKTSPLKKEETWNINCVNNKLHFQYVLKYYSTQEMFACSLVC